MSKSDWALVALNVATLLMAVVGLAAQHVDPMGMALALTLVTTLVNGAWVLRRNTAPRTEPSRRALAAEADELDARELLDIDARLEALERRERESAEADRIRQLVATGQQRAPEAEPTDPPTTPQRVRP